MLHESLQRLLDRLLEQTRKRRINWMPTSSGAVAYEAEKYFVVLSNDPQTLQITDKAGNALETASAEEIGLTPHDGFGSFQGLFEELHREAARQARGAQTAVDELLAELDIDGDGIPDVAAPVQESQLPETASAAPGDYEDTADESGAIQTQDPVAPEGTPHDELSESAISRSVRDMADGMGGGAAGAAATLGDWGTSAGFGQQPAQEAQPDPVPTEPATDTSWTSPQYSETPSPASDPVPSHENQTDFGSAPMPEAAPTYEATPTFETAPAVEATPTYEATPTHEAAPAPEAPQPGYTPYSETPPAEPAPTIQTHQATAYEPQTGYVPQEESQPQTFEAEPAAPQAEPVPQSDPATGWTNQPQAETVETVEPAPYQVPDVTPATVSSEPVAPPHEAAPSFQTHYETSQVPQAGFEPVAPAAPQAPEYAAEAPAETYVQPAEPVQETVAMPADYNRQAEHHPQVGEAPAPHTATTYPGTGETLGGTFSDASQLAGETVRQAGEAVSDAAGEAYQGAAHAYEEVAAPVSQSTGLVIDATDDVVDATLGQAGERVAEATETLNAGFDAVGNLAADTASNVQTSVNDTLAAVTETATQATEEVGAAVSGFGEQASAAAGQLGEQAATTAGQFGESAAGLAAGAGQMLRHGGDQVEQAASQFGEAASEVSGKLVQPAAAAPERPEPEEPDEAARPKPVTRFNPWN